MGKHIYIYIYILWYIYIYTYIHCDISRLTHMVKGRFHYTQSDCIRWEVAVYHVDFAWSHDSLVLKQSRSEVVSLEQAYHPLYRLKFEKGCQLHSQQSCICWLGFWTYRHASVKSVLTDMIEAAMMLLPSLATLKKDKRSPLTIVWIPRTFPTLPRYLEF